MADMEEQAESQYRLMKAWKPIKAELDKMPPDLRKLTLEGMAQSTMEALRNG